MKWIVPLLLFAGASAVAQPLEIDSLIVDLPSIWLGDEAPYLNQHFEAAAGGSQRLEASFGTTATVVVFWVDACPWTIVNRNRLDSLISEYWDEGVGFLFAELRRSGDTGAPSSGPQIEGVPLLLDPTSELTRAYGASVAPEVFVFDSERRLVYAGAIDDSPADEEAVRVEFLAETLEALVSGERPEPQQEPALGCIGTQDRQLANE